MYSATHNFAYIHIPKTGGTSFRTTISKYVTHDFPSHSTTLDVKKVFPEAFCFSIVRNTWDRLYSLYWWSNQGQWQTFGHFLYEIEFYPWKVPWSCSQIAFMVDSDKYFGYNNSLMRIKFDSEFILNKVYYYQKESADLIHKIGSDLGISLTRNPHYNYSHGKMDFHTVYSPRMVQQVKKLYGLEIEIFGFKFE